ncbi:hypothetical protein D4758_24745 [Enterocloster citroniae]|nr:hypothetical protein [Enterocloster citroniae]MCC3387091.1 hypothetical protein [Enterocloster citroniae]
MLYPERLQENEYIRILALRRNKDGEVGKEKGDRVVACLKNFEQYKGFILKYRYTHDVYNQIATNREDKDGTIGSQRMRRVLYLDFDQKDYPYMKDARDFTKMIRDKIPKLFIHAYISSGHGFHYYISVKSNCDIKNITEINKSLANILGADLKAVKPTQISRPPCTFNHKIEGGTYDYDRKNIDKWSYVKVINNSYGVGKQFKQYDLPYISKLIHYYNQEQENIKILERTNWKYETLNEYPCYLCVRKMLNEGADKGQRNFWHGRIVKMLRMEGYQPSRIYSVCQEYNLKCIPPKSPKVIEEDTANYLKEDYHLLGCYESFKIDDPHRKFVESQCDKVYCGTYHNGAKISIIEGKTAKINKKILTRKNFRETKGHEFLILTILEVYKNSYGRRGFRIKNLQELLYSSIQKKSCIGEKRLIELIDGMMEKGYIEVKPDKSKPDDFRENRLKLSRRLNEFQQGHIEFYFSIANALIDGKISQIDYIVYIALVNNLQSGKKVTYEALAETIGLDKLTPNEIGKHIRKLSKERCLIIQKQYTDKGYEWNKYKFISPHDLEDERTVDYEVEIKVIV